MPSMTPEEVDALKPGLPMDEAVAEHVMLWRRITPSLSDLYDKWESDGPIRFTGRRVPEHVDPFCPSGRLGSAWLVVEQMKKLGYFLLLEQRSKGKGWDATYYKGGEPSSLEARFVAAVRCVRPEEAICRAALGCMAAPLREGPAPPWRGSPEKAGEVMDLRGLGDER